jgi:di/tricarboxylate transporter
VVGVGAGFGTMGVLIALYVVTVILTELVTNNAAAALMFPIALASAGSMGEDPRPFALVLAIAASMAFATPLGYQTNLMVYGPGGYRFSDFLRLGLPLHLLAAGLTLLLAKTFWLS